LVVPSLVVLFLVVPFLQVPSWRVEWRVWPRVSELAYPQPDCSEPGLVLPLPDDLRVSKVQFDARALRERAWPRAVLVELRVLQAWRQGGRGELHSSGADLAFLRARRYAPARETQRGWVEQPALRVERELRRAQALPARLVCLRGPALPQQPRPVCRD